jgi:hypothetical protein
MQANISPHCGDQKCMVGTQLVKSVEELEVGSHLKHARHANCRLHGGARRKPVASLHTWAGPGWTSWFLLVQSL